MSESPRHFVAVIGGAVSGSVAAETLADRGIEVVVIEQNDRPYGKIEDGLPRWHVHQRTKEYAKIDARLSKPRIHYLPRTKLGRDLDFTELSETWGLSAVLLANGAWRDRPLPFPDADDYIGKGIEYQNPLIYWFNHKEEDDFPGRRIHVPEGTIVFGGGLASIDVMKVCQMEIYQRALRKRGIETDTVQMEKKGIPAICAQHGIEDPAELGVENCMLVYRRRRIDMPLAQPPAGATPEQMEKVFATRDKLLGLAEKKFLFRYQDKTLPYELITEDGHVKGVKVRRTEVEGRKATPIPGTEDVIQTGLIVGSIGSIPEPIEGIRMNGHVFDFQDWDLGIYSAEKGIFGIGNVVTGQGNIRKSLLHAQLVCKHLEEHYFPDRAPLPPEKVGEIRERVRALQERVGYSGNYEEWISKVTPPHMR